MESTIKDEWLRILSGGKPPFPTCEFLSLEWCPQSFKFVTAYPWDRVNAETVLFAATLRAISGLFEKSRDLVEVHLLRSSLQLPTQGKTVKPSSLQFPES